MIRQTPSPLARTAARPRTGVLSAAFLLAALLLAPALLSGQSPERVDELMAAGRAALGRGEAAAAAAAFAEAARLDPGDAEVFFQLGSAHESLGEKAPAVAAFRRAFELDPGHVPTRRALVRLGAVGWSAAEILERAELLSLEGRLKEAVYLFQRYLQDEPQSARAVLGLARCRERLGETGAARELYRRALGLDPDLEEARSKLEARAAPSPPPPAEPEPVPEVAVEPPAAAESRNVETAEPAPPPSPTGAAEPTAAAGAEAEADLAAGTEAPEPVLPPFPVTVAPPQPANDARSPAPPEAGRPSQLPWLALALAVPAAALALLVLRRRRRRSCSIRGRIENFPLPDALQLLEAGRKEGVLEVSDGSGGWISLAGGRVVAAESGNRSGTAALFAVLSASSGTFAFYEKPLPEDLPRSLDLSVQEALLQWAESVDGDRREPGGDEESLLSLEEIDEGALNIELPF